MRIKTNPWCISQPAFDHYNPAPEDRPVRKRIASVRIPATFHVAPSSCLGVRQGLRPARASSAGRRLWLTASFILLLLLLLFSGCGSAKQDTSPSDVPGTTGVSGTSDVGSKMVDIYIAPPEGASEEIWEISKAEVAERFRIFADGADIDIEDLGNSLHVKADREIFLEIDPQTAVDHLLAGPSRFGFLWAVNQNHLYLSGEDFTDCVFEPETEKQPQGVRLFIKKESLEKIRNFHKGHRTLFFCQKGTAKSRYRDRRKKVGPTKTELQLNLTALCFPLDVSRSKNGEIRIVPKEKDPRFCKILLRCLTTQLPFLDLRAFVHPDIRWQSPNRETATYQQERKDLASPVTETFFFCEDYEGLSEQAFDRMQNTLTTRLDALEKPYALGKSKSEGILAVAFGEDCPDSLTVSLLFENPKFALRSGNMDISTDGFELLFEDSPSIHYTEDGHLSLDFTETREYLYKVSETAASSALPLLSYINAQPIGVSHPQYANGNGLLLLDELLVSPDVPDRLSALTEAAGAAPIYTEFVLLEILTEAEGSLIPVESFPKNAYLAYTDKLAKELSAKTPRLAAIDTETFLRFSFTLRDEAPITGYLENIRAVFAVCNYPKNPFECWQFRLVDENHSLLLEVTLYTLEAWDQFEPAFAWTYDAESLRLEPEMEGVNYKMFLALFEELTAPYRNPA